jgi:hypothetical protein
LWPTVRSPILSLRAKLRMACELMIRRRLDSNDESLAHFACRRFGRETFQRLIQPLVSGIYMADPEKLSIQAALPRFVEMEAKHGSLIRAARHSEREQKKHEKSGKSSAADGGVFVAPRTGLGTTGLSTCSSTAERCDSSAHSDFRLETFQRRPLDFVHARFFERTIRRRCPGDPIWRDGATACRCEQETCCRVEFHRAFGLYCRHARLQPQRCRTSTQRSRLCRSAGRKP